MNYIFKNTFIIFSFLCIAFSCEDTIEVNLNEVDPELVIDAWINNSNTPQVITLNMSQPFFEAQLPSGVSGGAVQLTRNDGVVFDFVDMTNGQYIWTPTSSETLGDVGHQFILDVSVEGKNYLSSSEINRVPVIDSIHQEFRENELIGPDGIYAELYARDFDGVGDTYYARTYKNGLFLNKPAEMFITYDGTFGAGLGIDGITFIRPIREFINRIPDDDEVDNDIPPYTIGDSIYVELFSITNEAFFFLQLAQEQMLNGDNGIFTIPIVNTRGNVIETETEKPILGFFNTAAIETKSKVIE